MSADNKEAQISKSDTREKKSINGASDTDVARAMKSLGISRELIEKVTCLTGPEIEGL